MGLGHGRGKHPKTVQRQLMTMAMALAAEETKPRLTKSYVSPSTLIDSEQREAEAQSLLADEPDV